MFFRLHLLALPVLPTTCPALENPEPLQVLKRRHVEERDTACHRLPQHLNPNHTPGSTLLAVLSPLTLSLSWLMKMASVS